MLTKSQKNILEFLQGDLPLCENPYGGLAAEIGITEKELEKDIARLKKQGYIRRMGAFLDHRNIGLRANCMCVWKVPPAKLSRISALAAQQARISHCYLRKTAPGWDYNFYTMIHCRTKAECRSLVKKISRVSEVNDYKMLFTLKQFKKTSPRYDAGRRK